MDGSLWSTLTQLWDGEHKMGNLSSNLTGKTFYSSTSVSKSGLVRGNLVVNNTLTLTGETTVEGNLKIASLISNGYNLTVKGDLVIAGSSVTSGGSITSYGNFLSDGTINTTRTSGAAGSITVNGDFVSRLGVTMNGTVPTSGVGSIGGSLTVRGNVTISGILNVSGSSAFSGNGGNGGAVTINGNCSVERIITDGKNGVNGSGGNGGNVTIKGSLSASDASSSVSTSGGTGNGTGDYNGGSGGNVTITGSLTGASISCVGANASSSGNGNGGASGSLIVNGGIDIGVNSITLEGGTGYGTGNGGSGGSLTCYGELNCRIVSSVGGNGGISEAGNIKLLGGCNVDSLTMYGDAASLRTLVIAGNCSFYNTFITNNSNYQVRPERYLPAKLKILSTSGNDDLYDYAGVISVTAMDKGPEYYWNRASGWVEVKTQVDNVTIEEITGTLQVKDDGITEDKISDLAVTDPKLASGVTILYNDGIIVEQLSETGTGMVLRNDRIVGFKFIPASNANVDKLTVNISSNASASGTITAYIYSDNSGPDVPLGSGSIPVTCPTSGGAQNVDFIFTSPISVSASTVYWTYLVSTSAISNNVTASFNGTFETFFNGSVVDQYKINGAVYDEASSSINRIVKTKPDGLIDPSLLPVIAGGYQWVRKTSAYTAVDNDGILADTSVTGAFQINLPSAPTTGTKVKITDTSSNFSTANLTVATTDSATFNGAAGPLVMDVDDAWVEFVFDSTIGANGNWSMIGPGVGSGGSSGWSTSLQVAASGGATVYVASNNDEVFTDTVTNNDVMAVQLPISAVIGDRIRIVDGVGDWSNNNVTVDRNGHNIDSTASNFTLNIDNSWIELVYVNSTIGWRTIV